MQPRLFVVSPIGLRRFFVYVEGEGQAVAVWEHDDEPVPGVCCESLEDAVRRFGQGAQARPFTDEIPSGVVMAINQSLPITPEQAARVAESFKPPATETADLRFHWQ